MRRFLPGVALSLAFIAGCVAAQLSHLVVPPASLPGPAVSPVPTPPPT